MKENNIIIVMATNLVGAFGNNDGSLPWPHNKGDMRHFAKVTKDVGTVVMGVKTFKSLPSVLKGRNNIVVVDYSRKTDYFDIHTKDHQYPDLIIRTNKPEEINQQLLEDYAIKDYCVIGGKTLILEYLDSSLKTKLDLSIINDDNESDIMFSKEELKMLFKKSKEDYIE